MRTRGLARLPHYLTNGARISTRRVFCQPKQNYLFLVLIFLLCICFLSTLSFWDYVAENAEKGTIDNPSPYSIKKDGHRKLRSMVGLLNMSDDVAGMFDIAPLPSTKSPNSIEVFLPRRVPDQACFACQSSHLPICPEIEIPNLVGMRKPNPADRTLRETEGHVFNDTLDFIRQSVNRSNAIIREFMSNPSNFGKGYVADDRITQEASKINRYSYLPGGHWIPIDCLPRWKVAIIIPYRNRSHHLPILLDHMIPILQRQRLEFGFYIIEQANDLLFNRAMLMNVGYLESLNFTKWDCFIFHDVDHLMLNDYNYHGCSAMPRHFVSGSDRWKYKLPYDTFFGAVTGLTRGQIRRINGFPNVYWGWGGEDDEIWNRVKELDMEITRAKGPKGHYDVIRHHHQSAPVIKERFALLKNFKPRSRLDGLNNLVYEKPTYTLSTLYTNISVNIQKLKQNFKMPPTQKNKGNTAVQSKLKGHSKPKPKPPPKKVAPKIVAQKKPVPKAPPPKPQEKKETDSQSKPEADKLPMKPVGKGVVKIAHKVVQVHPKR